MGRNISYKILEAHLVSGTLEAGNEIGIRIDQTLTQDATGTMAFLQFEAMGLNRVQNELAVSYIDNCYCYCYCYCYYYDYDCDCDCDYD